jgi:hypothetical protein
MSIVGFIRRTLPPRQDVVALLLCIVGVFSGCGAPDPTSFPNSVSDLGLDPAKPAGLVPAGGLALLSARPTY